MISDVPYANVVAGLAILVLGFGFHFAGQLVSVLDWDLATRLGLQERDMPAAYRVYEHGIAVADVALGWTYGLAAVGLFLDARWGYQLAFVPAAVFVYHGISAWVWEANRRAAGHGLFSDALRVGWCAANVGFGAFAFVVAWAGTSGA